MAKATTLLSRHSLLLRHLPALVLAAMVVLAPAEGAAQSKSASASADQREMDNFRLTKAKMDKWISAQWGIVKLAQAHPELATEIRARDDDDASDDPTLDELAAQIEKVPEVRKALQRAGLTAREYALTTFAVFEASFAYAAKKEGLIKEIPAEVPAAHVTLVAQYEAEMIRLQAEMKKLEKPAAEEPDDEEDDEPVESDTTRFEGRGSRGEGRVSA
jgi:hypothetical protein